MFQANSYLRSNACKCSRVQYTDSFIKKKELGFQIPEVSVNHCFQGARKSYIASSRNGGRECGRNGESATENAVFKSLFKE